MNQQNKFQKLLQNYGLEHKIDKFKTLGINELVIKYIDLKEDCDDFSDFTKYEIRALQALINDKHRYENSNILTQFPWNINDNCRKYDITKSQQENGWDHLFKQMCPLTEGRHLFILNLEEINPDKTGMFIGFTDQEEDNVDLTTFKNRAIALCVDGPKYSLKINKFLSNSSNDKNIKLKESLKVYIDFDKDQAAWFSKNKTICETKIGNLQNSVLQFCIYSQYNTDRVIHKGQQKDLTYDDVIQFN